MAWPTPQEYNEAVQNPAINFEDADLRTGHPETNTLQLPKAITGGFASVYRIHCQRQDWAVRCFLRELVDQQQRYAAVSRQLTRASLPCMVQLNYLQNGIRIRGQWYPILKMQWIKGE